MEGKKKYVVIALLLLLGFGAISFAGGGEDELDPINDNSSDVEKDVVKDEELDNEQITNSNNDEEEDEDLANQVIVPVQTTTDNNFGNNDISEEETVVINPTSYVATVEQMIYEATSKENVGDAKSYYGENNVKDLVDALEDGELKSDLTARVEKLEKVFEDTEGPVISGIEDGKSTNQEVQITVSDELDYKLEVTLNGLPYDSENNFTEEGTYKIVATDLAQNTGELTFTIDKVIPVLSYSTIRINKDGHLVGTYNKYTTNYYVTDGDTFTYAIAFEEKLLNAPKLTIGGKEVILSLVDKETYRDEKRIYLYEGVMTISSEDNLEQGELRVELNDVVDEAGNQVVDEAILKPNQTTNNRVVVYDSIAPKLTYVAILSKKDEYTKAIKGDTIRFLVRFNEEIDLTRKTFKLKFDGKEINFIKSQDVGYEYIVDYTIPSDSKMESGDLKFEIYGYTDKALNGGDVLTTANHGKYNKVVYDGIAPTIKLVGNQGLNKNEHRVIQGSRVYLHNVTATMSDNMEETKEINPISIKIYYPKEMNKAGHEYTMLSEESVLVDKANNAILDEDGNYIPATLYYFDTEIVGVRYELKYSYTDIFGNTSTKTMLIPVDAYKNPEADENGVINITKNINNGYIPFYNVPDNTREITINGNNHTVTQEIKESAFYWNAKGNRSMLGNMFSSTNGSKITINDLTFKGTTGTISLGQYIDSKSNIFNTELNNVNIVGLNVVSFSSDIAPGVVVYGKATLNNVNLYGTKLSELDNDPAWPVWDLAAVNYTTTNINDSKVGTIYTWAKTSLTISNSEVDTIYSQSRKTSDMTTGGLVIEAGSKVDKIIVANKSAKITIKAGAEVGTIDYSGLSKSGMTIDIQEGAIVNSEVNFN